MLNVDVVVVGGGIVGLATAKAISASGKFRVAVIEKEPTLAKHQTGHNSGVSHSGLYYKPGSHKARTCTEGRLALERYCEERAIGFERCGKIVVAISDAELPRLDELERRGKANGLKGMTRVGQEALREREPHVAGIAGLIVPETGIVDYVAMAHAMADDIRAKDGHVITNSPVLKVNSASSEIVVESAREEVRAKMLVGCAGAQSDRLARLCGLDPQMHIVPFRGEYYELVKERESLCRHLIYPVPDPAFPFLGPHFTRMIKGGVEAGPNAVLAFAREGYESKFAFRAEDAWDTATYGGFWKMASKHWASGMGEVWRSLSKSAFTKKLAEIIPELRESDLVPAGSGIRAQAIGANGALIDDFHFAEKERMVHVLNAPSPAATASLAIGQFIAEKVMNSMRA